jgi:hypothetical protein
MVMMYTTTSFRNANKGALCTAIECSAYCFPVFFCCCRIEKSRAERMHMYKSPDQFVEGWTTLSITHYAGKYVMDVRVEKIVCTQN